MTQIILPSGGYRKLFSFTYVCLIYHATCTFCRRNYNYQNDALGKTTAQMIGAARSARQNIVEGSMRSGTSKETELRLYDVAKGSLEELSGDYEAFLVEANVMPWGVGDPQTQQMSELQLDPFEYGIAGNARYDYVRYLQSMRRRFGNWLEAKDAAIAANANLLLIDKANRLLFRQMEQIATTFCQEGGFTERMSRARLEQRDASVSCQDAPKCPICGKNMRKVMARKGRNAGKPFWSCVDYPNCNGSQPI